ncbi:MAG: PAS domain-containing protein, partial [Bacteroidales bacterium]
MENTNRKSEAEILRQRAEALLKKKSEAEILELVHELAIQKEEMAKQADELLMANKELAFQQENLRKIASLVPGVVYQYLLRPNGTSCFPYASEAIRDIYRVSPDEIREDASAVFANLHPDDLSGVAASIQASAQTLTLWQHEYRVKFSDGTIRSLYG